MSEELDFSQEEQELYEHHHFVADKKQSFLRIDKFLTARLENTSRSRVQAAASAGNIHVNGKEVKSNYKVKPLDIVKVLLSHPPREIEIIPENIPVNILYEDDDIMVIFKEAGMVVHPGFNNYSGTLVNALLYHMQQKYGDSENIKPHLVHRIDKDTSGILLVAKNEISQSKLARQFFEHTIKREYLALVWADFEDTEGTITGHIGRSLKDRRVMSVFTDGEYGKHAVTHYKVEERFGYVTLMRCWLETGRTHQIRAHFRHIGHPLFNDATYGGDAILRGTTFTKYKQFVQNCFKILPRQALHARSLGFVHPESGEDMFFEKELPADMSKAIEKWRHYAVHKKLED